jgi:polyhydroxybutyrate depolymerase
MRGLAHFSSLCVLFVLFGYPVLAAEPSLAERQWQIDGVIRKALVYVPPAATTTDTPLVFAFHGHGGTMLHASRTFAYQKHWPEAMVVYMQGLPTPGAITDPDGKLPGWQKAVGDQGDRDLKFFDEVLASLKKDYKVDDKRIFATGHSNGGAFTYLLWAARGEVFAAVAPSAAVFARGLRDLKPKPALHVAGEKDQLVSFAWQSRMMQAVRRLNGCDAEGTAWAKSGSLVGTLYPSKTGTPFVSLVYPGTHTFPPEAPELIVRFFKENGR